MTCIDPKTFFTALAFATIMSQRGNANDNDTAERIRRFAHLIEAFSAGHAAEIAAEMPVDAAGIDELIAHHIRELREKEATRLPEDRPTLLKLHENLNIRNLRRINRAIYAKLSTEQLADIVLDYLDHEITAAENGGAA